MSFGNYLEDAVLDHVFGTGADTLTAAATLYVAIGTSDPGETGLAWGEPHGVGNYARKAVFGGHFGASSNGTKSSSADIQFGSADGAAWGSIGYFGIFDAGSAGNFYGGGQLSAVKYIADGDIPKFSSGNLTITLG